MAFTKIVSPGIDTTGSYTVQELNTVGVMTAGTVQVGSATTVHTTGIDLGSGNITSHNINSTGIITATSFVGPVTGNITGDITATSGTFSGNVSIGGTLTYEDVTNVDSIGIVTAQSGIHVTGGSVGIGTNLPTKKLQVFDSSATSTTARANTVARFLSNASNADCNIQISNGVDHSAQIGVVGDGAEVYVAQDGIEKLRIDSGGKVGIGTDNPARRVEIFDTAATVLQLNSTNSGGTSLRIQNSGTDKMYMGLAGDFIVGQGSNVTDSAIRASGSLLFATGGGTERLRITSAGNVGINTTTFAANGTNFKVSDGTISRLALDKTGANARKFEIGNFGTGLNVYDVTADDERLRIDSSGRVLIGATTNVGSSSVLQVREDGFGRNLEIFRSYDSANTPARIRFSNSRGTSASPTIVANGDDLGEIRFNGHDGTNYDTPAASIFGVVDGTPGVNDMPGRLEFHTTSDTGSSTTERLRIDSGGRIAQGGKTPTNHGSPNLLIWGSDPTVHLTSSSAVNNAGFTGIKFAVAGGSTGDYSKAGIFVQRQASYNDLDMIFAFRSSNDAVGVSVSDEKLRINSDGHVGINQSNPSRAKLHVVGPSTGTNEIIAKFKGGSGGDCESRIALVAGYSDTANDTEGHVYLAARRNGNGNSSHFSVYCSNGGSMTERLKLTNGGEIYLNGSNGGQRVTDEYNGSVSVTNANTDAFAFRLLGSSLGSGGLLYISGTSGNVVVNVSAEILLSHSTHIVVKSMSNNYTNARIRIVTNNNESGDVYIGRHNGYGSGTTTLYWRFIPYGTSYISTTSGNYSNSTHTHTTTGNSFRISGTNGGNVNASGSKNFLIDHPLVGLSTTTKLAHAAVEGPECNTIYRGKVDLVDGTATVNIDTNSRMTEGTFVALNQNVQCFTTNETGWTAIKGSVSDNLLTITAQDNTCTDTISWMVVGEGKDQDIINNISTDSEGRFIPEITDEYDPSQFPTYPEES